MINTLLIRLIKFYQLFSKNIFFHQCRFYPTCSDYCILALQKYKFKGLLKCFFRVLRCNPLFKGGIDLP